VQDSETPFRTEWRFVRLGEFWAEGDAPAPKVPAKYTCQPGRLAVVSDLPIKRLTRATPKSISG
jgi:hypothetical protein